ncbi:hypothetical protein LJ725_24280 [Reyranella aquatilis]|uniref:Lipoprotein n=1 Tax=Reyranella aquatilis TaxID=2035356 RepID=A0ABS8L1A8_9HYPH|nr:hypothetical protein [Reyranella aquatilis]MCC8432105.1 hypothetical protein [Reyranella aquatilis]
MMRDILKPISAALVLAGCSAPEPSAIAEADCERDRVVALRALDEADRAAGRIKSERAGIAMAQARAILVRRLAAADYACAVPLGIVRRPVGSGD